MKYLKTAICENCEDDMPYYDDQIKMVMRHHEIGPEHVHVDVMVYQAYCGKCGHPVYPHELEKKNDIIVYDEYRRKVGLLTSSDIKRIRKKRKMSQVELARFIHCGEKNIVRYENGGVQDPVFDYLIRLVDDDVSYKAMKRINDERKQALSQYSLSY